MSTLCLGAGRGGAGTQTGEGWVGFSKGSEEKVAPGWDLRTGRHAFCGLPPTARWQRPAGTETSGLPREQASSDFQHVQTHALSCKLCVWTL